MRIPHLALLTVLVACGGRHPGAYTAVETAGEQEAAEALLVEADALWAERDDEAQLQAALEVYERALAADSTNRHALERLTRGWYFWGDAFTDDEDLQIERWAEAIAYGTRCLALNEEFRARIDAGDRERDAVAANTIDDVPCLYWTATALGKWGRAEGLSTILRHRPTVLAYISKVEELDPEFFYYGPARYWGAYYSALPSFAGQDFEKSAEYFAASLEGAPEYLGTRVLRAEFLAVPTSDLRTFDRDLRAVLRADPGDDPDIAPENAMEQAKAKRLLEERSTLFGRRTLEAAEGGDGDEE